jgi:hypothetical protein
MQRARNAGATAIGPAVDDRPGMSPRGFLTQAGALLAIPFLMALLLAAATIERLVRRLGGPGPR